MINNKRLGTAYEREICDFLAAAGYWVHFIAPDARGAQPFDIIAVRSGIAYAIDCKTCASKTFSIERLEDNQIMAFERWMKCGNGIPYLAVKHKDKTYWISYNDLKSRRVIDLEKIK